SGTRSIGCSVRSCAPYEEGEGNANDDDVGTPGREQRWDLHDPWTIAAVLVIAGIVSPHPSAVLWGIVLIAVGLLAGPRRRQCLRFFSARRASSSGQIGVGWFLVDRLAKSWGFTNYGGSTHVWFRPCVVPG
ncbi:MAG: GPGG-motif small membrane protein, partial [Actinomycetota bacterium]